MRWSPTSRAMQRKADTLAFSSNQGLLGKARGVRESFNWYYRGDVPQCELDVMQPDPEAYRTLQACAGPSGRVWLVMRYAVGERIESLDQYIRQQSPSAGGLLEAHSYEGLLGMYLLDLGPAAGTAPDR